MGLFVGGGAVPILFQIMCAPQFFFTKFRKKYAWNINVYTGGFRVHHQRSLAPIMNDFLMIMMASDIQGRMGRFPDIRLATEENPRIHLNQEN